MFLLFKKIIELHNLTVSCKNDVILGNFDGNHFHNQWKLGSTNIRGQDVVHWCHHDSHCAQQVWVSEYLLKNGN